MVELLSPLVGTLEYQTKVLVTTHNARNSVKRAEHPVGWGFGPLGFRIGHAPNTHTHQAFRSENTAEAHRISVQGVAELAHDALRWVA
eukprot:1912824-Alexandrium_andersonii.AAC.1